MENQNQTSDQINIGDVFGRLRGAFDRLLDGTNAMRLLSRLRAADDPDGPALVILNEAINSLRWGLGELDQYCQNNQTTCFILPILNKALAEHCARSPIEDVSDPHGNLIPSAFMNAALADALAGGMEVSEAWRRYQELIHPEGGAGELRGANRGKDVSTLTLIMDGCTFHLRGDVAASIRGNLAESLRSD